mgnify:CR=1 FL=1
MKSFASALLMAMFVSCIPAVRASEPSFQGKVVVVVSPHSTDYLEGAGGIIAKMIQEGATVYLIRVTNDEKHGYAMPVNEVRVRSYDEAQRAAAIMGFKQVIDLNLKDGEVTDVQEPELRGRLSAIYRKLAPTTLVTADPWALYDPDLDDQRVARAAVDACWNASSTTFYPELPMIEGPTRFQNIYDRYFWTTNGGVHPENQYFDVTGTLQKEFEALEAMPTIVSAEIALERVRHARQNYRSRPPEDATAIRNYLEQRYGSPAEKLGRGNGVKYAQRIYHYEGGADTAQFIRSLEQEKNGGHPPKARPALLHFEKGEGRVVLMVGQDFPALIQHAGGTAVLLSQSGFKVDAVIITNQDKDGNGASAAANAFGNQADDKSAAEILGIRRIFNLGFEQGRIADTPPTVVRDSLLWILRSENPEMVILPDPWIRYTDREEVLIGRIAADAVYRMTSLAMAPEQQDLAKDAKPVSRILYWEDGPASSRSVTANVAVDVSGIELKKEGAIARLHAWLSLEELLSPELSAAKGQGSSGSLRDSALHTLVNQGFTTSDKDEGKIVGVGYAEEFHQIMQAQQ